MPKDILGDENVLKEEDFQVLKGSNCYGDPLNLYLIMDEEGTVHAVSDPDFYNPRYHAAYGRKGLIDYSYRYCFKPEDIQKILKEMKPYNDPLHHEVPLGTGLIKDPIASEPVEHRDDAA